MPRVFPRPRRYVAPTALTACRPLLAYDMRRDAYTLRGIGGRYGPVLRPERRGGASRGYNGPERRGGVTASVATPV